MQNEIVNSTVSEIVQKWDLNNSITNGLILEDVESALCEAVAYGISLGGMDSCLFEEALEFVATLEK